MAVSTIKGAMQTRTINVPWQLNSGAVFNTNLYPLINNDMPSGYRCLGVVGYSTGQGETFASTCRYADNNFSLEIRNTSSGYRTGTAIIHYLCTPN